MLYDKLKQLKASRRYPMHMPGHKRSGRFGYLRGLGAETDVTEIEGFDDLHAPSGIIKDAMERAARVRGADAAFFLVNGTTSGIMASVYSLCRRGGSLLMSRCSHKSVYRAAELAQCEPVYLKHRLDPVSGAPLSLSPAELRDALGRCVDPCAVLLTSPTYEGVISDVASLADICHEFNVPLIVDAAHGAHLGYGSFPSDALSLGADISIESLHKTLPSLTQTSALFVKSALADPSDIARSLEYFETSSPSYLLLASIDGCFEELEANAPAEMARWMSRLNDFHRRLRRFRCLKPLFDAPDPDIYALDPSKLVISTANALFDGAPLSGPRLASLLLDEYGIDCEMAAANYIIAMTGYGDTAAGFDRFYRALKELDSRCTRSAFAAFPLPQLPVPERRLSVRAAGDLPSRSVPLSASAGLVSAEYVWAYPPGVPYVVPGEVIPPELPAAVDTLLSSGISLKSTFGGLPGSIRVLNRAD